MQYHRAPQHSSLADGEGLRQPVGPEQASVPGSQPMRQGWSEAAAKLAALGDDKLVLGDFDNSDDATHIW